MELCYNARGELGRIVVRYVWVPSKHLKLAADKVKQNLIVDHENAKAITLVVEPLGEICAAAPDADSIHVCVD